MTRAARGSAHAPQSFPNPVAMVVAQLYGFDQGRKLAERWSVPIPRKR